MTRRVFAAGALLTLASIQLAGAATLAADGQWVPFDVAQDLSGSLGWIDITDGNLLSFAFTVPTGWLATLTVVDGGFAGDRFRVFNGSALVGETSAAVNSYPSSIGLDFDAALLDSRYSQAVFTLFSGAYNVTGLLLTSALDNNGAALNSTVGGVRLTVSAVPEPAAWLTMSIGMAALAAAARRTQANKPGRPA